MKRGFTLMELLAVIVVLALIALILIPNFSKSLGTYRSSLLDTQIKNIEVAARQWAADNIYFLPTGNDINVVKTYEEVKNGYKEEYGVLIINLKILQENGYIDKNIKNSVTNEVISSDLEIRIINQDNKFKYEFNIE